MVKEQTVDLRYKIKNTAEILRTESPTKIAKAILAGYNPPDLKEEALVKRIRRLLAKKHGSQWVLERRPGSGRSRSVLTPIHLGRIKKFTKNLPSDSENMAARRVSISCRTTRRCRIKLEISNVLTLLYPLDIAMPLTKDVISYKETCSSFQRNIHNIKSHGQTII